jgi:hypothetical protein
MLKGEFAVSHNEDTVQICFFPLLEPWHERAQLGAIDPDGFRRGKLPLVLAADWDHARGLHMRWMCSRCR